MDGFWRRGFSGWGGMGLFNGLVGIGQRVKRMMEGFLIYLLAFPVILFYVLIFAGCVSESPGLPNLYLVSIKSTNTSGSTDGLTVNVGYFGMCAYLQSSTICSSSISQSGDTLARWLIHGEDDVAINFFEFATHIQDKIFVYLLAFAGPFFIISLLVFALCILELNNRDPTNPDPIPARNRQMVAMLAGGCMWTCFSLNLASAVGTTQAANALQYLSNTFDSSVMIRAGPVVMALEWLIVAFTFIIALRVSAVCHAAYQVPIFIDGSGGVQQPMMAVNPVMAQPMMQAMPVMDPGYAAGYGGYGGGHGLFGGFNPFHRLRNW